jgi:hypothetical protein
VLIAFYLFLKLLKPHISEKLEIFLTRPIQNAGHPNQQVCDDVAAVGHALISAKRRLRAVERGGSCRNTTRSTEPRTAQ